MASKYSILKFSICGECKNEFPIFAARAAAQKVCPSCRDKQDAARRHVDAVVVSREKLFTAVVLVDSLPGEWRRMEAIKSNADHYWKIEARGSDFGRAWDGQITINSAAVNTPPHPGTIAHLRVMKAVKRVKTLTFSRPTLEHGETTHTAVLPVWFEEEMIPDWIERGKLRPQAANGHLEETEMTSIYCVLNPSAHRRPTHALVWAEAHTKTTLKGFGAQYTSRIEVENADWHMRVRGGVRSGRAYTEAVLAAVPLESNIVVASRGMSGSGSPSGGYNWQKELPARDEQAKLPNDDLKAEARRMVEEMSEDDFNELLQMDVEEVAGRFGGTLRMAVFMRQAAHAMIDEYYAADGGDDEELLGGSTLAKIRALVVEVEEEEE